MRWADRLLDKGQGMKITKSLTVRKPVAEVWQALGPEFSDVGAWASGVYTSRARGGVPVHKDAPCVGRVCQTSLGPFTETIERYDVDRHTILYSATGDKMPGFVRRLANQWTLHATGPDTTRVTMELGADLAFPFSVFMGWAMKRQFNKVLGESIEEFGHFVETGTQHPRKRKVDAHPKAVAARSAFA